MYTRVTQYLSWIYDVIHSNETQWNDWEDYEEYDSEEYEEFEESTSLQE